MADPYSTLGVARNAGEKDIKSAYRKLAKELHPDRNTDNPKAAERFSEVTRAYDLLSDKDKRARFDRGEIDGEGNPSFGGFGGGFRRPGGFRDAGGPGGGPGGKQYTPEDFEGFGNEGIDLGDIFEGLFGGGGGAARGGGSPFGANPRAQQRSQPPKRGENKQYRLRVAFADAAIGKDQRITLADGKTIDLKLPQGVEDGTQMRLKGKGAQGPGGAGDGLVTITIDKHAFFRRDGDDVRLDLPVTLDEAVGGARIKVPTVDGAVMLTIAPGSSTGMVMRLKGKGFQTKGGGRGDQLVTLEIEIPPDDAELARRLEGWRDTRDLRAKFGS